MFDLWCCLHLAHILIWTRTSTSFLWQSVAVIPLSAPLVHPLHIPTSTWGWIILLTRLPALRLVMFLAFSSPPHHSPTLYCPPSSSIHPLLCFTYLSFPFSLSSCNPGWPVCVWAWGAAGAGPGQGEHQQRDGGSSSSPRGGGHIWAAKRLPVRHYRHQWVVWEWPLWQNHIPANSIVHWDIMPHREWKLGIQEGFIGSL